MWYQGQKCRKTDRGGFCKKDGNGCGEYLLPKKTTYEWRKVHTGGLYLKQKVQSEKEEVVSGGESNWATLDGSL